MKGFGAILGALLCAVALPASAGAAIPESLGISPEDGKPGAEAGQLDFPLAVAAQGGLPGHIFISTNSNNRIDELTPWGEFVKAWGWGVDKSAPAEELQVCTAATGCKKGSAGGGRGQVSGADAIALGPASDLYVAESANHRVQRFGLDGHFISTFGDGVNKSAIEEGRSGEEDICPAAGHPDDVCQAGVAGNGPGQLGAASYVGQVAVCGSSGRVFVGEGERIQVFDAGGAFQEAIAMPAAVAALTIDPACNLYAAMDNEVRKLKPNGPAAELFPTPIFTAESLFKKALALDPAGNLYAAAFLGAGLPERVLEFDPAGKCLVCGGDGEGGKSGFDKTSDGTALWAMAVTAACGPTDLYVVHFGNGSGGNPLLSYVNILGPSPDTALCPQPPAPPKIEGTHAVAAGTESARVAAAINPKFWPDTTYRVQYGTAPCPEGCEERPPAPGAVLTSKVIRAPLPAEVPLSGLAPATTYHYRFIAESGGGGPVLGEERTFTTLPPPAAPKDCPNRALRTGPSANLPDCRAYEMVSPVEKANGDILAPGEPQGTDKSPIAGAMARVAQATPEGEALSYNSARAFGDALSSPWSSQYVARRGAGGWSSHSLNPPREGPTLFLAGIPNFESLFKGFGEDLCNGWVMQDTDLALAPGAPTGIPNLYRRRNCGAEGYEALVTSAPAGFSKAAEGIDSSFFPTLQGFTQDGSSAAFKAPGKLTEASTHTVVGESLDCSIRTPAGTTSTYTWLRNGAKIGSAENKPTGTYVVKKADEGKALQCQVKTSNEKADEGTGGFVGSVQTSIPAEVVAPYPPQAPPRPPATLPAPSSNAPLAIGGGGGQTLSCDAEEAQWSGTPTSFAWQWYRNGTELSGKTEPTYSVSAADLATSAAFQCAVTATNPGGATTRASEILTTTGPDPKPTAPESTPIVNDVYEAYLNTEGALHLVSVTPGGQAVGSHASIGTTQGLARFRLYDSVAGAVSQDGSRVFWSAEVDQIRENEAKEKVEDPANPVHSGGPPSQGPSVLFLRANAGEEQSALVHAAGTGNLEKGKAVVKGVAAGSGAFAPGQAITGVGIPAGTMIEEVSGTELTLSREALETKSNVALDAIEDCSEPEKACTLQITPGGATFLAADPTAGKALYSEGTKLYELDADKAVEDDSASAAKTLIAGEALGVVGASTDLSHVYLVSKEVCSSGPNSHGDEAQLGKPNLYLYETGEECSPGELDFVATLKAPTASGPNDEGAYTSVPVNHRSRVSADGLHVAFMSQAPLTGFDSTDAESGKADSEVFLYDAPGALGGGAGGQLRCASCNATGARPTGRDLRGGVGEFWAAAAIPGWENEWHAGRVLSDEGSRLYFESSESLVSRDTNGAQDVYEWERAADEKECLEGIGGELFIAQSGGCLGLISPGKGSRDSEFLDASASGSDVFFTTVASLVPEDPGLVDVYDARELGGFPSRKPRVKRCEGEGCQPPAVAPDDPTPASGTFEGQGNLKEEGKPKPRCPKGKHMVRRAGKKRCVPRRHKHVRHHGRSGR
jgi:hypothetical protein